MKQNAEQGNKSFHWKLAKCFFGDSHMIHKCFHAVLILTTSFWLSNPDLYT